MRELEIKILNVDLNEMEKKIIALGGKLISKEDQINTLIDSKNKHIEKNLDSYCRIRTSKSLLDNTIEHTLTIKENIERQGIRENIETNVQIGDKDAMIKILEKLGYFVYEEGEKRRTSYSLENIRFDLDIWDKATYPYPYMEIELEDERMLDDIVKKLSIGEENISTKSILELRQELNLD